jgi:hypothetical protein
MTDSGSDRYRRMVAAIQGGDYLSSNSTTIAFALPLFAKECVAPESIHWTSPAFARRLVIEPITRFIIRLPRLGFAS